jgi:hypothetical protein
MYVNRKTIPVEWREEVIKENGGRGEFKYDTFEVL